MATSNNSKPENSNQLSSDKQQELLQTLKINPALLNTNLQPKARRSSSIPTNYAQFEELPQFKQLQVQRAIAEKMNVLNPFFACHQTMAKNKTKINDQEFYNFSTYDYLGLNGHPQINAAAIKAMEEFGTSAGASRLVSGERPPHRELEEKLAKLYKVENALTFVSGHATNVSVISTLFGREDVIYHDALAHNSIIQGAVLSGAKRYSYAHNDPKALEELLKQTRSQYKRALIVSEGIFSMDGSIVKLNELIELKKEYVSFLMIDEAHSLGILGKSGRGCSEYFNINPSDVDIWMGTLSKTLCSCGGFVTGSNTLIDILRFCAAGFIYSVGMSPPLAAASAKAIDLMRAEPERVQKLQEISSFFLEEAKKRNFNTGYAQGYGIIPIIVGSSLIAGRLATHLFNRNINVMPIIYPVVEEGLARLRFFLSSVHQKDEIIKVLDIVAEELPKVQK
ncbi:aminotransferase class I/II-fold pyridoxal phosphate-dependent enzyme [Desulfovibrio litoralis]|uniref:8-amino-7-oxononanoate synthase n=1 Tax=Desulfovibrio litoralis DSM 11393 TaxID=1121455 RepID=A0A1M7TMS6_9BACT|nr:aminotransferase class I/II-fold pyridoxal phosphate-dependent enzyme [Desulfovibrio litoralis]SHN72061.1 8-amino-7-oxononanoate synthase [Desulfovibrio litoralis DSM 11393]